MLAEVISGLPSPSQFSCRHAQVNDYVMDPLYPATLAKIEPLARLHDFDNNRVYIPGYSPGFLSTRVPSGFGEGKLTLFPSLRCVRMAPPPGSRSVIGGWKNPGGLKMSFLSPVFPDLFPPIPLSSPSLVSCPMRVFLPQLHVLLCDAHALPP